jgi:hypothetical protein
VKLIVFVAGNVCHGLVRALTITCQLPAFGVGTGVTNGLVQVQVEVLLQSCTR